MIRSEPFSSEVKQIGATSFVKMAGVIDEHARLPEFTPAPIVVVHLAKVTAINSVGSRAWLGWLQRLRPPIKVQLEECPVVFVKSFNMVRGFLTPTCEVTSFYVPYYSEDTGERKDVLAIKGRHFDVGAQIRIPPPVDSRGAPMELDVVESSYLAFLER